MVSCDFTLDLDDLYSYSYKVILPFFYAEGVFSKDLMKIRKLLLDDKRIFRIYNLVEETLSSGEIKNDILIEFDDTSNIIFIKCFYNEIIFSPLLTYEKAKMLEKRHNLFIKEMKKRYNNKHVSFFDKFLKILCLKK